MTTTRCGRRGEGSTAGRIAAWSNLEASKVSKRSLFRRIGRSMNGYQAQLTGESFFGWAMYQIMIFCLLCFANLDLTQDLVENPEASSPHTSHTGSQTLSRFSAPHGGSNVTTISEHIHDCCNFTAFYFRQRRKVL